MGADRGALRPGGGRRLRTQLADEAVDDSNLNGLLKAAIHAIPASLIDNALTTDDLLRRTIDDLDLRTLLANLGNSHDLTTQVDAAVTKAVTDALTARLSTLL